MFRAVAASQDGARDGLAELGAAIAASWRRLPDRFRQLLPTLVAWAAALWFAVYFAHHTIETHFRLGTSAYDLGLEDNLLWNLLYGDGPAFKSSPLGKDAVHFSFHATLVLVSDAAVLRAVSARRDVAAAASGDHGLRSPTAVLVLAHPDRRLAGGAHRRWSTS